MTEGERFYGRSMELPDALLAGAIDSHAHAGPVLKSNPGHQDPFQVATEARDAGMRAIVYYDVFGWASGTAWMVNRHVSGIRTFGGYLMNSCPCVCLTPTSLRVMIVGRFQHGGTLT